VRIEEFRSALVHIGRVVVKVCRLLMRHDVPSLTPLVLAVCFAHNLSISYDLAAA
jgi:hypothetical protein